jgi:2-oxo-4-hydroxy-4-carboxy-5-ureidoimidazoline decarboxylase
MNERRTTAAARVDQASLEEARAFLRTCCGSTRWVERMLLRRPYRTDDRLLHAARDEWFALGAADWREAFAHHPKIGDRASLERRFAETADLSAAEQRLAEAASSDTLDALAELNRAYEEKFGYIFIICAMGKSADEMLAALRARLDNDAEAELRIAAEEQAKITALRLTR